MRKFLLALAMTVVLVLPLAPSTAQAAQGCIVNALGIKVCGELVGQPLPPVVRVTITPDPIKIPGPTVTIVPPQKTVTVPGPSSAPQPGQTKTVYVPGPTKTVTASAAPQRTPQATPQPTVTETAAPYTARPETRFAQPRHTGQERGSRDRMVPEQDTGFFRPDIDFGDNEITAGEVGLGTLTLLALVGLLLLAMYAGYVLGYKDKESSDTDFMRALLDTSKLRRGKHS